MRRDVRRYVAETIEGLTELELAVFFGNNPHAVDDIAGLARRVGRPGEDVAAAVDSLVGKGVLQRRPGLEGAPPMYALTPARDVRQQVIQLGEACRDDDGLRRDLAAEFSKSGTRWLYEQIVGHIVPFTVLRTRFNLALQLAVMALIAAALFWTGSIASPAIFRALAIILGVTTWSAILLIVARAVRRIRVPRSRQLRGFVTRYRQALFHPMHLEALPGLLFFWPSVWLIFWGLPGRASIIDQWLGTTPGPVLTFLILLLTWDVAYRMGVGVWVIGVSLWRAAAFRRAWPKMRDVSGPHVRLAARFRRADRPLVAVPAGYVAMALVFWGNGLLVWACLVLAWLAALAVWAVGRLNPLPSRVTFDPALDPERYRELRLQQGSKVAIIGGGPAGALFAHLLLRRARRAGLDLDVTIYDSKDFRLVGPPGCNMCAGVISGSLHRRLTEEGIELPERVVQSRVTGFRLHTPLGTVAIAPPAGSPLLHTVFRGNGPPGVATQEVASFDDYLLSVPEGEGVRVVRQPVREVLLPSDPSERVRFRYGPDNAEGEADLLVGAFGLNSPMAANLESLGFGYAAPRVLRAWNAELAVATGVGAPIGDRAHGEDIHVFTLSIPGVVFAAATPKGRHITVTIIGKRPLTDDDLRAVTSHPAVRQAIAAPGRDLLIACHCRPRFLVRDARGMFTDRVVMIGDASCSRLYKNGLESAFLTADLAARTAVEEGVSWLAFAQHYYRGCRRQIIDDNWYGRLIFAIHDVIQRGGLVGHGHIRLLRCDSRASRELRGLLWDLFTGARPYRELLRRALSPRIHWAILGHTLAALLRLPEPKGSLPRQPAIQTGSKP